MKTALELLELANKQKKNKVAAVLNGAFDHIEKRIEEEQQKVHSIIVLVAIRLKHSAEIALLQMPLRQSNLLKMRV